MSPTAFRHRLWIGICSHPCQFAWAVIGPVCVCYSTLWAILDPLLGIVKGVDFEGWHKYFTFLGLSLRIQLSIGLVFASVVHGRANRVSFLLPNTNTRLVLLFADFFSLDGCKIIAVSEFFDSQLGDIVSPRSLHGQFIQSKLGGLSSAFNDLVNPSLSKCEGQELARAQGRKKIPYWNHSSLRSWR